MGTTGYSYQTIAFIACLFAAGYLTYLCWTPPNPPPATLHPRDRAGWWPKLSFVRGLTTVLWLYHAALALTYPEPPPLLCPYPQHLTASLFHWSRYAIVCLALIFIGAPIRILAFAQLGRNFTFQLAKPRELIKTGMYAYVRHPSYTGHFIVGLANVAMLQRPGGVTGCWLPTIAVAWGDTVFVAFFLVFTGLYICGITRRVSDEEEMLKQLGKEWEIYQTKTKRFVPGLF
jgi:protein-S-isoprenylcysteine O-methyltransferase Ste14